MTQQRVDTRLVKKVVLEIVDTGYDRLGSYVILKMTGTENTQPVTIYKGDTLTIEVPLEVHIGW